MIEYRGKTYATGNNPAEEKLCSASRWPVQRFNRPEIEGLITDKHRLRARNQFGPDWCYDQGPIGSCNGVSAAGALRRSLVRAGVGDCPPLSGEWLYSRINDGKDKGSLLDDGMAQLLKGVAPWNPKHKHKYKPRDFTKKDTDQAKRFKALECYGVDSELQLATGLSLGFVGVVAVHVGGNDWFKMDRNKIIIDSPQNKGPGNHAVVVDDIWVINGELCFDHMGSWSPDVHDAGRAFLTWGRHLKSTNKSHYFYLVRAVNVDDPEDNIPELKKGKK